MPIKSYRGLDVWRASMEMVMEAYRLSKKFPDGEKFGLTSQLNRAAVSAPSNIAEGYGRNHRGDYLRHLSFARGSVCEMETLITIAVRLKMISRTEALPCWELTERVGQMLTKLIQSLSTP